MFSYFDELDCDDIAHRSQEREKWRKERSRKRLRCHVVDNTIDVDIMEETSTKVRKKIYEEYFLYNNGNKMCVHDRYCFQSVNNVENTNTKIHEHSCIEIQNNSVLGKI